MNLPSSLIKDALYEDLRDIGDITSRATIPETQTMKVTIRSRKVGVLAGINIAAQVFKEIDNNLQITTLLEDGNALQKGQDILYVEGNARHILMAERVALNFISHLSGIASETANYVAAVEGTKAQILDTRKTLPMFRSLQKHAVKMGGGTNHRFGLYDAILIKDNHIAAAGGTTEALDAVSKSQHGTKIEIEVDTLEQLQEVLDHGTAHIVLLDNMAPNQLKQAVTLVNGRLMTEASGNVNLDTVRAIAKSGVDYISIGALTHSVTAFDIGLDIDG